MSWGDKKEINDSIENYFLGGTKMEYWQVYKRSVFWIVKKKLSTIIYRNKPRHFAVGAKKIIESKYYYFWENKNSKQIFVIKKGVWKRVDQQMTKMEAMVLIPLFNLRYFFCLWGGETYRRITSSNCHNFKEAGTCIFLIKKS